jgi:hypothetical protein
MFAICSKDEEEAAESFFMVQVGNSQPQRMKIHTETLQVAPPVCVFFFSFSFLETMYVFRTETSSLDSKGKGVSLPGTVPVLSFLPKCPASTYSGAGRHYRYLSVPFRINNIHLATSHVVCVFILRNWRATPAIQIHGAGA